MGSFNTVILQCPRCNTTKEVQTKAGSCQMDVNPIYKAELADLADLTSGVFTCDKCQTQFKLNVQYICSTVRLP